MLQLITENKELRKKKEEWNEANHAYQKKIIKHKHKVERPRKKEATVVAGTKD